MTIQLRIRNIDIIQKIIFIPFTIQIYAKFTYVKWWVHIYNYIYLHICIYWSTIPYCVCLVSILYEIYSRVLIYLYIKYRYTKYTCDINKYKRYNLQIHNVYIWHSLIHLNIFLYVRILKKMKMKIWRPTFHFMNKSYWISFRCSILPIATRLSIHSLNIYIFLIYSYVWNFLCLYFFSLQVYIWIYTEYMYTQIRNL